MNKIVILILFALLGVGVFLLLYYFDPLPPYTTQIVNTINGISTPITEQARNFFTSALGIGAVCSTMAGLAVNYVRSKMQAKLEDTAKQAQDKLQDQLSQVYNSTGQLEAQKTELEKKLAVAVANQSQASQAQIQVAIAPFQAELEAKQAEVNRVIGEKNELERVLAQKYVITKEVVH